MVDLIKAIDMRCSRRKYLPKQLEQAAAETLQSLIADICSKESLKMQLVVGDGDAFNGFRRSYGMFTGVRNFVALIEKEADVAALERLGYFGEHLVLHCTALGLGTCWVGGTFSRKACPVELGEGEKIVCAITVGYTENELSAKEKLTRWGTHRKTKTAEQMYNAEGPVPEWFMSGMEAVQKAPSAVNRQPVTFSYRDGAVTAAVEDIAGQGYALDLGIAKLHFKLGTGCGEWDFGNGAVFTRE